MREILSCRFQFFMMAGLIMVLLLLVSPPGLSAHGVAWEISAKKSYGLEFTYDDESPLAYAEVKVFGPNDPAKLSQTGRTDKNGYFAFIPDAEGQWLVVADDGSGHMVKAQLPVGSPTAPGEAGGTIVDAAAASINTEREIARATKPIKIGLVISFFLNVALVSMLLKRKKAAL